MRYFMSIMPPADLKPEDVSQGLMDAMGPWMDRHMAAGTLISTGGLKGAEEGRRLKGAAGTVIGTHGPFAEAKEVLGGYAVVEAPDREAATALASEFMKMHIENGIPDLVLELREIAGGANYSSTSPNSRLSCRAQQRHDGYKCRALFGKTNRPGETARAEVCPNRPLPKRSREGQAKLIYPIPFRAISSRLSS